MKKTLLLIPMLVAALGFTQAQEVIPRDELLKASYLLWNAAVKLDDVALKVDVDIKNPYGMAKGDIGMVVIPETKVADVLAKASETPLPLGQLWLKDLVLEVDGKAVPDSKLKLVEVSAKNEVTDVVLCTLGVRKTEKNGLELVIYGKGKEPLKTVALKAVKGGKQEFPIEFSVTPGSDNADILIKVLG
ncbi:MAG: hypothetical protein K0Q55_1569, partial [Verrucomicrobia bacterium]|nr:hypothetical protein [Verrucomicrobiota bacterium]